MTCPMGKGDSLLQQFFNLDIITLQSYPILAQSQDEDPPDSTPALGLLLF